MLNFFITFSHSKVHYEVPLVHLPSIVHIVGVDNVVESDVIVHGGQGSHDAPTCIPPSLQAFWQTYA